MREYVCVTVELNLLYSNMQITADCYSKSDIQVIHCGSLLCTCCSGLCLSPSQNKAKTQLTELKLVSANYYFF